MTCGALMCAMATGGFLAAQEAAPPAGDGPGQVNEWMAERAERMTAAYRLETELSRVWGDEKYTSPEIEALRKRYRDLQQALALAQAELKEKVLELPELQEKQKRLAQERQDIQELSRKVDAASAVTK
jgi:chromosome segregation ATPase